MFDASDMFLTPTAPSDGSAPSPAPAARRFSTAPASSRPAEQHAPSGAVGPQFRRTGKVAIVGKAPSSANMAPWKDESFEIWGLSYGAHQYPRWDRWFEVHPLDVNKPRWPKEYWKWLTTDHGKPLYISEPHPEIPHGIVYPRQEVMKAFGRYFTNSIAWMQALQLYEHKTGIYRHSHIELYGVDMACSDEVKGNNGEYQYQRPCCEFFLGMAIGMGITVGLPDTSDLLKCSGMYGIDPNQDVFIKKLHVRQEELRQRIQQERQKLNHCNAVVQNLEGALADTQWTRQWVH